MAMPESIGTCDNCGLCCQQLLVEADAVDVMREPRIDLERPIQNLSAQLSVLDACPFLTREKRCDIYSTRPQACVAFVPGSPKCQEIRAEHGLGPAVLRPSPHRVLTDIMQQAIQAEVEIG